MIPKGAQIAIDDMLDSCARVQPGQEVLILSEIEGLYGGDAMVDQEAVSWIQASVQARGANASVLWIDEPTRVHAWRFPPVAKAAMSACDILINHSFNLVTEEIAEFRAYIAEKEFRMVRNFAPTAPLLCTNWAQTPYELVSEIRYRSSLPIIGGLPWQIDSENGTHLEGIIEAPKHKPGVPGMPSYSSRREEAGYYLPWPEWVHPPILLEKTQGIFIFNSMLSWWSRYIGISPYFNKPIKLTIDNNRIKEISGGYEADALKRFLESMRERLGDGVYDFNTLHFGVHPQASVAPHQCPNILFRRIIDHSHSSNIHVHIGAPPAIDSYPYWMHCTGDIRDATFRVGDTVVHDHGHLTCLDSPEIQAIVAKYPDRPGIYPQPTFY